MPYRLTSTPEGPIDVALNTGDGTPFTDFIFGDDVKGFAKGDFLRGFGGADFLYGGVGNDQLLGGAGADLLNGGLGRDSLKGGPGSDIFEFETVRGCRDTIKDFVPGEDVILIWQSTKFTRGIDGFTFDDGNRLWYDKDGDGGKAPKLIARLNVEIDLDTDIVFA